MRVLLVHNRYRNAGGEERHVELLAGSLAEAGAEVSRLEVASETLRTRRSRAFAGATVAYNPVSAALVRNAVLRNRSEIAHFHNVWPILTPAALHGARQAGAKVVLTTHNYRFACPTGTLVRRGTVHDDCLTGSPLACALRALPHNGVQGLAYGVALAVQRRLRMLERWVDAFVAPTDFAATALRRAGFETAHVRVIRLAVPENPPPNTPPSAQGVRHALYAGRLAEEKGVSVLVEAARLAPEVRVVIAGSGPLASSLSHRLPTSVSLAGQLDQAALSRLRSSACMTVVPSTCFEVCGYAALEAGAAGCAVIGSRIGGIPEFVIPEETGLLVRPGDAAELAGAMRRLWHDPELAAALGEQAAERAARHHALPAAAEQHLALYTELAA